MSNYHHDYAVSAFGALRPSSDLEVRADAQIQAILSLAYEQRTANLIALYAAENVKLKPTAESEITEQIQKRLGLS